MPQISMRAKMRVAEVLRSETIDTVVMRPVCKPHGYSSDGLDEDNTFARFSPSGELKLGVANPDLIGKINPGETFYVDFTPVPPKTPEEPPKNEEGKA